MHSLLQDLRFALRQFRRAPGFVATAVLTLALGIGATTAIFTLVYQVILRPLPVPHPEQLYKIGKENRCCVQGGLQGDWSIFSYDFYKTLRDDTPFTSGIAAVQAGAVTVSAHRAARANETRNSETHSSQTRNSKTQPSQTQPLSLRFISGNYFSVLGVSAYTGRLLGPADDRAGADPAAVVSYMLWQTEFAADPGLVGSTLLLSGHPVTVVGIAAANFLGERNEANPVGLWLPLAGEPVVQPDSNLLQFPASHWLDLLVRIPHKEQLPQVQLALQGGVRRYIGTHPELAPQPAGEQEIRKSTTELVSARSGINSLRDQYQDDLRLLLLITGFVLLIACANLANLMLVRGMARAGELAVRCALGAPRVRLIRQMLAEATLLALGGGAAALFVAYAGTRAILALAMKGVDVSPLAASPSLPVLGFALLISLLTGVLFGIAPAWIASRTNPIGALRGANRSTGAGALPQKVLVILQAALSLALLTGAGLLISSLRQLEHRDFHFEPRGRLIVFTDLQAAGYTYNKLAGLYGRMDDTFARLPGVENFAYATYGPMAYNNWSSSLWFPAREKNGNESASYVAASSGYFSTVGTKTLLGRGLSRDDTATSRHVAVVNKTFADRFLPGKPPIGERFGADPRHRSAYEIVGVVEDAAYGNPKDPAVPMFFTPITQAITYTKPRDISIEQGKDFATNLIVQFRGDPAAAANGVREALKGIDPEIPVLRIVPYGDQVEANFTQEELVVRLTTLFGLLALVLASLGLYGVTAYTVARRTGEIGVRMALGASRAHVLGFILRGALSQALIGLALGVPLSLLAGRLLQHSLYQTNGFQPGVLLAVTLLLLAAALLAAFVPAHRASSINPTEALRAE